MKVQFKLIFQWYQSFLFVISSLQNRCKQPTESKGLDKIRRYRHWFDRHYGSTQLKYSNIHHQITKTVIQTLKTIFEQAFYNSTLVASNEVSWSIWISWSCASTAQLITTQILTNKWITSISNFKDYFTLVAVNEIISIKWISNERKNSDGVERWFDCIAYSDLNIRHQC
jgi:hypothetical protein